MRLCGRAVRWSVQTKIIGAREVHRLVEKRILIGWGRSMRPAGGCWWRSKKGAERWHKLNRGRNSFALRAGRRIRDMRHKSTRQGIDFCQGNEVSDLYIGDPDGVCNQPCGRKQNQRMSQLGYGKDIKCLGYKSTQAGILSFSGPERGTSSRCPKCGH
jgi:putative transposase